MPRIHFIDVTNRDGVQTARLTLAKLQKTMVNYHLAQLGVYQSEFGFPFLHNEQNYIAANLELKEIGAFGDMRLGGWYRAVAEDVEKAILAGKYANGIAGRYEMGDAINLGVAWKLASYAAYAFEVPIPINQPGVGANAFTHESGIHADGALKDRHNYELYDYEVLGRVEQECCPTGRVILTGEYGGLAGFKHVYQKLGISFPDEEIARQVLELVQYANAHTQRPLTDDELRFIAYYPRQVKRILTVTPLDGQEPRPVGERPTPVLAEA